MLSNVKAIPVGAFGFGKITPPGAKNTDRQELVSELADLMYHSIVLMIEKSITIDDVRKELGKRMNKRKQTGKDGKALNM